MSLTLQQAEDDVREQTAHRDDVVRVTPEQVWRHLNREYRKLRSWLIDVAPQLYLVNSGDIVLPDAVNYPNADVPLNSDTFAYEKLHRVDGQQEDGSWREVARANPEHFHYHRHASVTWREEGGCLIFDRPDGDTVEGTFRVLFHATPPVLTAVDATFKLPHQLEDVLIWRAAMKISVADGDSYTEFKTLAKEALEEAEPVLRKRFGVHHNDTAGLRLVLPY
jgi:hypothetical protein